MLHSEESFGILTAIRCTLSSCDSQVTALKYRRGLHLRFLPRFQGKTGKRQHGGQFPIPGVALIGEDWGGKDRGKFGGKGCVK
jgi:hypothetical protein